MDKSYHPGDSVAKSGLYHAHHEAAHPGANSEITLIRGRKFPSCPHCHTVSFELLSDDELSQRGSRRKRHRRSRQNGSRVKELGRPGQAALLPTSSVGTVQNSAHFAALDGLRGVAASIVLFGHAALLMSGTHAVERITLPVDFFFMLSGFVIAFSYETKLKAGMSRLEFFVRRAIRLYPLIIAAAFAGAVYYSWTDPLTARFVASALLSALGIPTFYDARFSFGRFPVNPPEWSLFYEIVLYAVFAFMFFKLRTKKLVLIAVLTFVSYCFYRQQLLPFQTEIQFIYLSLEATASFCIGVCLWRLHSNSMFPKINLPLFVPGVALVFVCFLPKSWGWAIDALVIPLLFPVLIVLGVGRGQGRPGRFEKFLGEISYPVYITHFAIILFVREIVSSETAGSVVSVTIACLSAVIVAWVAFVAFDKPVRRWLSSRLLHSEPPLLFSWCGPLIKRVTARRLPSSGSGSVRLEGMGLHQSD